jgi:hypothetical protein
MHYPQSCPATISCRQTMTASKTFGGVAGIGAAGIGGAGERRPFESRLSLTYATNGRPQNTRMLRWAEVDALCFAPISSFSKAASELSPAELPGRPLFFLLERIGVLTT